MPLLKTLTGTVIIALVFSACGPHPSSGEWKGTTGGDNRYSRLKVQFDGKAFLFVPGREDHQVRCFWAGESATIVNMDCMLNDPSERRFSYRLRIIDDRASELLQNGEVLARFHRSTQK